MPERALVSLHRRTRGPKNEVFKITCLEAGARRDDEQTVGRETIANTGATAVMTTDQHSTFLQQYYYAISVEFPQCYFQKFGQSCALKKRRTKVQKLMSLSTRTVLSQFARAVSCAVYVI